jgi:hypothetical protein
MALFLTISCTLIRVKACGSAGAFARSYSSRIGSLFSHSPKNCFLKNACQEPLLSQSIINKCSLYREKQHKESQDLFCENFFQVFDFVQGTCLG